MIKLHYSNGKGKAETHRFFQLVADDVMMFNRYLNGLHGIDEPLPCPIPLNKESEGVANASELWFGEKSSPFHLFPFSLDKKKTLVLISSDKKIKMLYKLAVISVCEQFPFSKIETKEDMSEAITIYEELLGSIPDNVARSLNLKPKE